MKNNKIKKLDTPLDNAEQTLLRSFEHGEWKKIKNFKQEMATAKQAATNFLTKNSPDISTDYEIK